MREAVQIPIEGRLLAGTCHFPDKPEPTLDPAASARDRIGVILLNPGYLPRSTRGDLGVHLSDHLASLGFPAFRFDMPGLGDSEGTLPAEVLEFFEHVQTAGYERYFTGLREELMRRYHLRGVIYLGHCGGATTAVYSADKSPSRALLGMILLDPAFVWYRPPPKPRPEATGWRKTAALARLRLHDSYQSVRARVLPTPPGQFVSRTLARARRLSRRLQREPLPGDANVRLVRGWERIMATDKPLLVLTAEPAVRKVNYFDYLGYLDKTKPGRIEHHNIEGTSHSFVEGDGKAEVFAHVDAWLQHHFPHQHRTGRIPIADNAAA